ncbi:MAG TPA: hypothetical protein VMH28_12540 [Candidatus Acidoferrales bacterium]|nr:hypothetical protein [Candidatus Acidoferrales bacterium]
MLTKFILAFGILALVAFAGSIPAKLPVYRVTLTESVSIHGTALKAGEYRVAVSDAKVTFIHEKETHEVPAKVETGAKKYSNTEVQYEQNGGQATIKEICLGGTKTRLLFN